MQWKERLKQNTTEKIKFINQQVHEIKLRDTVGEVKTNS